MRGIFKMIARALSAFRTVWERCAETGRMVMRTVMSPFGSGDAGSTYEPPVDQQVAAPPPGMQEIRDLAGAFAANRVTADDLAPVSDDRIQWLETMERSMLAKIMCASDEDLRAHLQGKRSIRGVLAADMDSVRAYRQRMDLEMEEPEQDLQPAYGIAA